MHSPDQNIIIREITSLSDMEKLSVLGAQFHVEGKIPGRFIPEVFAEKWHRLTTTGAGKIWAVFSADRKNIRGALGCLLYNDLNDDARVASEAFWFVSKDERTIGMKLFYLWENWIQESGIERATMVHLLSSMPDKLSKLYRRFGYQAIEVHYIKEIK